MKPSEAIEESPYAVWCSGLMDEVPSCGKQLLTQEQYDQQMDCPNRRWACPSCGAEAEWDDAHYESRSKDSPEGAKAKEGGV